MRALTIWQPWCSLILIGAKPYEFREWDYRERNPRLEGQRIVIHAGKHPMRRPDIEQLIDSVKAGGNFIDAKLALPLLERILSAYKCQGVVEYSAALGTAVLGKPWRESTDHNWAWPLTDIQSWTPPVPVRGAQGFWNYTGKIPQQEAA